MSGLMRPAAFALLASVLLSVPATAAEESPLAQVPASAPLVVHVRGYERTRERATAILRNAMPFPQSVTIIRDLNKALDQLLDERRLAGMPKDGSIVLVLCDLPDDP